MPNVDCRRSKRAVNREYANSLAIADADHSPPAESRPVPRVDAYSLRLVSGHRLYDAGVLVEHSPALAQLVPEASLRANPHDLDQVGVEAGGRVRVTSPRGSLVLPAVPDAGIPRGSASFDFGLPGEGAADLIDAAQVVTEVRLESTRGES